MTSHLSFSLKFRHSNVVEDAHNVDFVGNEALAGNGELKLRINAGSYRLEL
jgi:hypothetical protein